jgi:hypothetical protein
LDGCNDIFEHCDVSFLIIVSGFWGFNSFRMRIYIGLKNMGSDNMVQLAFPAAPLDLGFGCLPASFVTG